MDSWESATILAGGVSTLAIYSFLIGENRLYRIFEHLFVGIAAGFGVIYALRNFLWPSVFAPLLGLDLKVYPDGTRPNGYSLANLLFILPICFGLLYYTVYSKRLQWLAKVVIGFTLGASAGLTFKGVFNELYPQVAGSFKPLVVFEKTAASAIDWGSSFSNIVFVVTLLSVMYYFFFSFKRRSALGTGVAGVGRFLMMICFGAFFGSTVTARMALLVERLQFLFNDWWPVIKGLVA